MPKKHDSLLVSAMELRILRYFLAVAKEETISGAAELMNVTQPTLSRQLMELEEELGKRLFIRGNRKITLTEEGHYLRKRAEEILDLADKTKSDLQTSDEFLCGDVFIGGGETDAMRLIAKTIKDMNLAYPKIRYHLFSGNADDVTEKLDMGLIDFGLLIEPVDKEKYAYLRLPAMDTWGLLMRKDSPYAKLDNITPKDLTSLPLLCSRQTMVKDELSNWFGKDFDKLNIVSTYNLLYNASIMVEEGVGYALCLDRLVNTTGKSKLCFRPLYPKLECGLVMVWKKNQIFSRACEQFLNMLQDKYLV